MKKSEKKKNSHVEEKRRWHLIDAEGKVLGRLASRIAPLLMGKKKIGYLPYLDGGDHVVVINAAKVKVTGRKETDKVYYRHSGYPGGLKEETLEELRKRRPEEIIRRAVKGMLPKNKLLRGRLKRLHIFAGSEHDYKDKFKKN
jgi:large subunit ribosomal protein L13